MIIYFISLKKLYCSFYRFLLYGISLSLRLIALINIIPKPLILLRPLVIVSGSPLDLPKDSPRVQVPP